MHNYVCVYIYIYSFIYLFICTDGSNHIEITFYPCILAIQASLNPILLVQAPV